MSIEKIQEAIENRLPEDLENRLITGIIGETASKTARSPHIWNPTFERLRIPAIFLPFDVSRENLPGLVESLREEEKVQGFSVTNPYKSEITPFLDEIEEKTRLIGAVNTVVRTKDSKLIGYNTDARGFIASLIVPHRAFNENIPFIKSLDGKRVILIGIGGAGRAIAFCLALHIRKNGTLYIANRTVEKLGPLSEELESLYDCNIKSIKEEEIAEILPLTDLFVNSSIKGAEGLKNTNNGYVYLKDYSSLAPAVQTPLERRDHETDKDLISRIRYDSAYETQKNRAQSALLFTEELQNRKIYFVDIIHSPAETVMLNQAKYFGHHTMNGKGMNVSQAVEAFSLIMNNYFESIDADIDRTYKEVKEIMFSI